MRLTHLQKRGTLSAATSFSFSSRKDDSCASDSRFPNFTWPGGPAIAPTLADIARTADEAGFASLWVMDHFFQIGVIGPAEHEMLEGYSALTYLAALTKNVKLGTLVTGVIYRYPGILVKTVTTLDVLSGGRAYLGIGAAWFEREALGLGVPYPSDRRTLPTPRGSSANRPPDVVG